MREGQFSDLADPDPKRKPRKGQTRASKSRGGQKSAQAAREKRIKVTLAPVGRPG